MTTHGGVSVVVGLGEIGRPLFNLVRKVEPSAIGVDIAPVSITQDVGLMHVCIPFDVPGGFVETTVAYAAKYRPRVIIVNSTVQPGTTRQIEERAGLPAVYSPIRGKHTRMEADLLHYVKFVAGSNEGARRAAVEHFASLGMQTDTMKKAEALELAKLLETTYFGLLIGWAQEMDRFAKRVDADYDDIVKLFAEVPYLPAHVFVPGYIGGHCVMPNIDILQTLVSSPFLDAIEQSNERKRLELAVADTPGQRTRVEPRKH